VNWERNDFIHPFVSVYCQTSLGSKRREGLYVYDWQNKKYSDLWNDILTTLDKADSILNQSFAES
jgi:hypothetical protein